MFREQKTRIKTRFRAKRAPTIFWADGYYFLLLGIFILKKCTSKSVFLPTYYRQWLKIYPSSLWTTYETSDLDKQAFLLCAPNYENCDRKIPFIAQDNKLPIGETQFFLSEVGNSMRLKALSPVYFSAGRPQWRTSSIFQGRQPIRRVKPHKNNAQTSIFPICNVHIVRYILQWRATRNGRFNAQLC